MWINIFKIQLVRPRLLWKPPAKDFGRASLTQFWRRVSRPVRTLWLYIVAIRENGGQNTVSVRAPTRTHYTCIIHIRHNNIHIIMTAHHRRGPNERDVIIFQSRLVIICLYCKFYNNMYTGIHHTRGLWSLGLTLLLSLLSSLSSSSLLSLLILL